MIRDLYINEEIMIFLNKSNKLDALRIRERIPKVVSQDEIEFIKNYEIEFANLK